MAIKLKNVNLESLVRENVKSMRPYSSARDEFNDATSDDMIFLDANENPFENGINRYPDPHQTALKEVLASIKNVSPKNILVGNGSDEVLDLLFRAFCEPNVDNVITLPPTYGMYGVLANLNAIENKKIILNEDFQPNVNSILNRANENTKLLFLCSPNNPTGNSFSEESVLRILNEFNGLVVIDEAYIEFSDRPTWLKRIAEFDNLIIVQTLSKAYGMAGLRLGLLFASPEIIAVLEKIKPPYNVNSVSQSLAIEKLASLKYIYEIEEIKQEREKVMKALVCCKIVTEIFPSETNFILFRVDNATFQYNQFLENGIVVRNRSNDSLCRSCLRISIGTPQENEKVIELLKKLKNV
ncbi:MULTISPECIES: histidinol-phosphate transaminase [unclassified Flavobacterium]|uniref:histidinol-phosphate transaminase n=1 Tax=unclassified Flavobacterium TaxID=196869 RepID=UPI0020902ABF|nr:MULTISPECIES: histidinol-phosphate transaminase [unclassified Flavobacterium]MCO6163425.1 histidinol-phosphate transaminase [Flavobacterium sp. NRK F7]